MKVSMSHLLYRRLAHALLCGHSMTRPQSHVTILPPRGEFLSFPPPTQGRAQDGLRISHKIHEQKAPHDEDLGCSLGCGFEVIAGATARPV